jgi:hypothetical protein
VVTHQGEAVAAARRHAMLRERLLDEVGAYDSAGVSDQAGSRARNRSQLAHGWRKEGRIFAVRHGGRDLYLAFQFGPDGRPRPVVARVLEVLAGWEPWDVAFWFGIRHPLLEQRRPLDVMATDPGAVEEAAAYEMRSRRPRPSAGFLDAVSG